MRHRPADGDFLINAVNICSLQTQSLFHTQRMQSHDREKRPVTVVFHILQMFDQILHLLDAVRRCGLASITNNFDLAGFHRIRIDQLVFQSCL